MVKKGKTKGARTRAIGDKVVDVCLETWRGYEAVDSLIAKVEELGRPIAESIKKWGVDVFGGCSDNPVGELDMTNIKLDSKTESLRDSAIGTPTDAGSLDIIMMDESDEIVKNKREHQAGQFFKIQPKHLGEDVVLKDYQLVGVNWLSLLYERKLSCILADEMGKSFFNLDLHVESLTPKLKVLEKPVR
jgi:SWI/SNF-related matrix-associated actin-dependent regulator 1 of chromatin subfamily A